MQNEYDHDNSHQCDLCGHRPGSLEIWDEPDRDSISLIFGSGLAQPFCTARLCDVRAEHNILVDSALQKRSELCVSIYIFNLCARFVAIEHAAEGEHRIE